MYFSFENKTDMRQGLFGHEAGCIERTLPNDSAWPQEWQKENYNTCQLVILSQWCFLVLGQTQS